jgi:hypothetical protein
VFRNFVVLTLKQAGLMVVGESRRRRIYVSMSSCSD